MRFHDGAVSLPVYEPPLAWQTEAARARPYVAKKAKAFAAIRLLLFHRLSLPRRAPKASDRRMLKAAICDAQRADAVLEGGDEDGAYPGGGTSGRLDHVNWLPNVRSNNLVGGA